MKIHEASLVYRQVREGDEPALDTPAAVAAYMEGAFDPDPTVEWFFVILLNRKNRPLGRVSVTKGTASCSLVHPREVFKPAVLAGASSVICVHNHPSGCVQPSAADVSVTRQLQQAAKVMGIQLLDHVIVGDSHDDLPGWYSFSDAGLL